MAETEGTLTALDVLRRDGWHQGDYASNDSPRSRVCVLGAANRAAGRYATDEIGLDLEWEAAVRDVISEQFPDRAVMVHNFNDHPDTTFADVELVLEKAQIRLDESTA